MSRALSLDLRVRVLAAVAAGLSHRAAAARFGVSAASISRWRRRARLEGDPGPRAAGGDRRSGRIEAHRGLVLDLVARTPDITIEELRRLLAGRGLGFGYGTVQRFLVRHRMTRKKKKWDGRLPPLMFEDLRDEWTLAGRRHQSAKVEEQALHGQTGGSEMKTSRTVVRVDTAKRVFQLHWVDIETGEIEDLKLTRAKFLEHFANRMPCVVAMEACGGSQHWARRLRELGHDPWLLPAKAVRPFVSGNKNDAHDARAIWTAAQMPGIKTVAVKSEEQQAVLALHRTRFPMMRVLPAVRRTALACSSKLFRSALGNRSGPGMTLAADAPTTDGSKSLATDTSGIVIPSQDRKLFPSTDPGPDPHGLRDIMNPPGDERPVAGAEARERKTGPGRSAVENRA